MRTEILQLKDLGRMPNESINDPDNIVEVIRSYDELLERIQLPISFDEAMVLVQIFPENTLTVIDDKHSKICKLRYK